MSSGSEAADGVGTMTGEDVDVSESFLLVLEGRKWIGEVSEVSWPFMSCDVKSLVWLCWISQCSTAKVFIRMCTERMFVHR